MNQTLRSLAAGAVAAMLVTAVVAAQPALADQLDKLAKKNSVSSKSIKDGSIKTKDLNAEVSVPLAKASTALQSVPDNSVTTSKLANNAVTNPKIADNAVTGAKVADHSFKLSDLAVASGTVPYDGAALSANQCGPSFPINTGVNVAGDILLVSAPENVVGSFQVTVRENSASATSIDIVICNNGTGTIDPAPAAYTWAVIDH
jgi:hypothetical protein